MRTIILWKIVHVYLLLASFVDMLTQKKRKGFFFGAAFT